MGKIAGISHLRAVKALEKAGFRVARQGKHIVMTDGIRIITVPRHDPVDAYTMAGIVRDAGLTEAQFRELRSVTLGAFLVDGDLYRRQSVADRTSLRG